MLDIDTQANPGRIGDPTCRYQGFIIPPAPTSQVLGGNPLQTLDDSLYLDVPGNGLFNLPAVPISNLYDLINRMKVEGTIVWGQIGQP